MLSYYCVLSACYTIDSNASKSKLVNVGFKCSSEMVFFISVSKHVAAPQLTLLTDSRRRHKVHLDQ